MLKLSANLGFLWAEHTLSDAIRAARSAGFSAVECHWPYDTPAMEIKSVLEETGLPMLGINTRRGNVAGGENGLSAVPGRGAEARHYINEASAYAAVIGCRKIHVMSGFTDKGKQAEVTLRDNLAYACDVAETAGQIIMIEPLNTRDAPGYHLTDIESAMRTIDAVGRDNLKLMFDCYHIQIMQGNLIRRLETALPYIAHIQIAGVPDRGEPDCGELNYPEIFRALEAMGYTGYIGAEYKPRTTTEAGLTWMDSY